MSDPVTLPLYCPLCGRAVTLRFSQWTPEVPWHAQTWKCPHCHTQNKAELPGKLVWVLARQADEVPPRQPKKPGEFKAKH